jgi:hypothetical protein
MNLNKDQIRILILALNIARTQRHIEFDMDQYYAMKPLLELLEEQLNESK